MLNTGCVFIDYHAANIFSVGKNPHNKMGHVSPLILPKVKHPNTPVYSIWNKEPNVELFFIGLKLYKPHERRNKAAFPLGGKN